MSMIIDEQNTTCHIVVLPYPGRGHINPMMNLCKKILLRYEFITITFVVTEEWLSIISSENKPENINFVTIQNILPSEKVRAENMTGFIEAILTKMEEPFEQLLDRFVVPPTIILADVFGSWVVDVGKRRNIPVALLWAMSATVFSFFQHFDLLVKNGHFPIQLSDRGEELVGYIPGLSPFKIADLPSNLHREDQLLQYLLKFISNVPKAQYLLFSSIYELESSVFEALKLEFPFPLYPLGPLIPYFKKNGANDDPEYFTWLNSQEPDSVLYVSLGSFLSVTNSQFDEIVAGLRDSGVKFLLVARDKAFALKNDVCVDIGMVVPWCDQLRVLSHPSIGGFWTHCGWNSTNESIFAGVPMIGFPIALDQPAVSKIIAEDWKNGWKLKGAEWGRQCLVRREEISMLVNRFMDPENEEKKEMIKRSREIREICRGAIQEGGSSESNLDSFITNILG